MSEISKAITRIFATATLLTVLSAAAKASSRLSVERLKGLSSAVLMDKADRFLSADVRDSALIYYSIVAFRYSNDLDKAEKRLCAKANIGLWNVYFYYYYDIARQYDHLCKAESILQSMDEENASLYLDFGAFYQNMSPKNKDKRLDGKAMEYYTRAYKTARSQQLESLSDIAFTNMITMAAENGKLKSIDQEWKDYAQLPVGDRHGIRQYNIHLYKGLNQMAAGHYGEAEATFRRQWTDLSKDRINNRYLYISLQNLAKAYAAEGLYVKAIEATKQASSIDGIQSMTDIRLEIYSTLAEYYRRMQDTPHAYHYIEHYYALKDSVLNYQQLNSINETKSLRRITDITNQLSEASQKSRLYGYMLASGAVILLLLIVLAVVLYHNNRRLNRLNRLLYEKSKAMIAEQEDKQRKRKEEKKADNGTAVATQGSNISTETGRQFYIDIMDKVKEYMETAADIYEPDFTVAKLATALGLNSHYVSEAINRETEGNFSTLLGRYRIIEVCRRLRDEPEYKNMTIEAMSLSVGFKSRTSFISAFKRTIGMTPSVYLKYNVEH